MALVLSLKQGHDFYVGETRYSVQALQPTGCTLCQHGETQDKIFHISCEEAIEVSPKVFIRAGLASHLKEASLAIKAPKDILILRGDIMNAPPNQQG